MRLGDMELMIHLFHITGEGDGPLAETTQNPSERANQVRALEEKVVQTSTMEASTAIKYNADLPWLLGVVNTMVRNIPASGSFNFVLGYQLGVASF